MNLSEYYPIYFHMTVNLCITEFCYSVNINSLYLTETARTQRLIQFRGRLKHIFNHHAIYDYVENCLFIKMRRYKKLASFSTT